MDVVQIIREVTEVVHIGQGSSSEIVVVSPRIDTVVRVTERGLQGPPGPEGPSGEGELDPDFTIDGGNF
jgi:hypothetical protein